MQGTYLLFALVLIFGITAINFLHQEDLAFRREAKRNITTFHCLLLIIEIRKLKEYNEELQAELNKLLEELEKHYSHDDRN